MPDAGEPLEPKVLTVMKIVPLGEHIVIKRLEPEIETAGGLVLPAAAQESPREGRVLSVGDGKRLTGGRRATPRVHEGDRVVFGRWAGSEIDVDGQKLLIVREEEILAIIA